MKLKILFFGLLMLLFLFGGSFIIISLIESIEMDERCDAPHFKSGSVCCLDLDSNAICDNEQFAAEAKAQVDIEKIEDSVVVQEFRRLQEIEEYEESKPIFVYTGKDDDAYVHFEVEPYYPDYEGKIILEDDYNYYKFDSDRHDLEIVVKDSDFKDRIEEAYVRVKGSDIQSGFTNDDGKIKFKNLEEDCYSVKVEKVGYDITYAQVCLHEDTRESIYLDD